MSSSVKWGDEQMGGSVLVQTLEPQQVVMWFSNTQAFDWHLRVEPSLGAGVWALG